MFSQVQLVVIILGILAAWSMGHHYSGAVVGTAYGSRAVSMKQGLFVSGLFVIAGALLTDVVTTYVSLATLGSIYDVIVLSSFVAMSNLTTYLKIPTSTIQLYVFAVLGSALATGAQIDLAILSLLIASWAAAPIISYLLGKGIFHVIPESKNLKFVIIGVMLYSALVLGLNDVSNAASSLVESGVGLFISKAICGVAMMAGMLTWGSRLVKRVGVDLLELDYRKAVAAQLTKSIVISTLNLFGYNASMNQTLVSALASIGARKKVLRSIMLGWVYSPLIGFLASYFVSVIVLHII